MWGRGRAGADPRDARQACAHQLPLKATPRHATTTPHHTTPHHTTPHHTLLPPQAVSMAFGTRPPVSVFSGPCAGLTRYFEEGSVPTATCPLAGNLLGDMTADQTGGAIVPAW